MAMYANRGQYRVFGGLMYVALLVKAIKSRPATKTSTAFSPLHLMGIVVASFSDSHTHSLVNRTISQPALNLSYHFIQLPTKTSQS